MELLSLIFTKKMNRKKIHNLLLNDTGFCLLKNTSKEELFINSSNDISIKSSSYKIEIMYDNKSTDNIIFLLNTLLNFNDNKKTSIKIYNDKEKDNLMQLLNKQKCYFV